ATFTREDVVISAGKNTQVDVVLSVAGVEENVTVGGEVSLINAGPVETGQTFTGKELTEIPTSRNVWALIQQVPGVQLSTADVAGNTSTMLEGPSITSRGSYNIVYAIGGATTTDNTMAAGSNGGTNIYFDFGTLQDVKAVTGGAALDQETPGVTINVVTK